MTHGVYELRLSSAETAFMQMMRRIMPRVQTVEEEALDLRKAKERDLAARDRLVAANAKVVIHGVRFYVKKGVLLHTPSLEIEDLFQEGVLGVHDAIRLYNLKIGGRFGGYATHRVRDFLSLAVAGAQEIWAPGRYLARHIAAFNRRKRALILKFGREPTQPEFLHSFGSKAKINAAARVEQFLFTRRDLKEKRALAEEDGSSKLHISEFVPDEEQLQPDMALALKQQSLLFELLAQALSKSKLTEQERFVIEHRYCDEVSRMTHRSIGKKFGVTESRSCQYEADAVRKILGYMERYVGPLENFFVGFRDA